MQPSYFLPVRQKCLVSDQKAGPKGNHYKSVLMFALILFLTDKVTQSCLGGQVRGGLFFLCWFSPDLSVEML